MLPGAATAMCVGLAQDAARARQRCCIAPRGRGQLAFRACVTHTAGPPHVTLPLRRCSTRSCMVTLPSCSATRTCRQPRSTCTFSRTCRCDMCVCVTSVCVCVCVSCAHGSGGVRRGWWCVQGTSLPRHRWHVARATKGASTQPTLPGHRPPDTSVRALSSVLTSPPALPTRAPCSRAASPHPAGP